MRFFVSFCLLAVLVVSLIEASPAPADKSNNDLMTGDDESNNDVNEQSNQVVDRREKRQRGSKGRKALKKARGGGVKEERGAQKKGKWKGQKRPKPEIEEEEPRPVKGKKKPKPKKGKEEPKPDKGSDDDSGGRYNQLNKLKIKMN